MTGTDIVPVYRWGAQPDASGVVDLGVVPIRRGSSLGGLVLDSGTERPVAGAEVRIIPGERVGSPVPESEIAPEQRPRTQRTDVHGFFQFSSLPPGPYALEIQGEDRVARGFERVEVAADSETWLEDLYLFPPMEIELIVDPPTAPGGEPWLARLVPLPRGEQIFEETVDATGRAIFGALSPGGFDLAISTPDGSRYDLSYHEHLRASTTLFIEVPLVRVSGFVTLDGEPLEAEIELLTGRADAVTADRRPEGWFEAWIPAPDLHWLKVQLRSQEPAFEESIEIRHPEIEDGELRLELELESLRIAGTVVTELGVPVAGATVRLWDEKGGALSGQTEENGTFELITLAGEAEVYRLTAEHREWGIAEPVDLEVGTTGTTPPTRLVLQPSRELRVRLLGFPEVPLPYASVTATVPDSLWREFTESDAQGEVRLMVPEGSEFLGLQVAAPSALLWAGCVRLTDSGEVRVQLPPPPGGVLELELRGDPGASPATDGKPVLYHQPHGFMSLDQVVAWNVRRTGAPGIADGEEGVTRITVAGVAPESWALAWTTAPWWETAGSVCRSGPPFDLDWEVVSPGGEATLGLGVEASQ